MKEPKYTKSRKKLQFIPTPVLDSMEWFLKANHVRVSSVERYFGMPSNALGHRHEKPSVTEAELARMTDIFDGDDTENAQEKIVRLDAQAKDLRGHHIRGNLTEIPENILTAMDKLAEELKCNSVMSKVLGISSSEISRIRLRKQKRLHKNLLDRLTDFFKDKGILTPSSGPVQLEFHFPEDDAAPAAPSPSPVLEQIFSESAVPGHAPGKPACEAPAFQDIYREGDNPGLEQNKPELDKVIKGSIKPFDEQARWDALSAVRKAEAETDGGKPSAQDPLPPGAPLPGAAAEKPASELWLPGSLAEGLGIIELKITCGADEKDLARLLIDLGTRVLKEEENKEQKESEQ